MNEEILKYRLATSQIRSISNIRAVMNEEIDTQILKLKVIAEKVETLNSAEIPLAHPIPHLLLN
jgi:hypothetical protein